MWQSYMQISAEHAFTAAFIQFMILGLFNSLSIPVHWDDTSL